MAGAPLYERPPLFPLLSLALATTARSHWASLLVCVQVSVFRNALEQCREGEGLSAAKLSFLLGHYQAPSSLATRLLELYIFACSSRALLSVLVVV